MNRNLLAVGGFIILCAFTIVCYTRGFLPQSNKLAVKPASTRNIGGVEYSFDAKDINGVSVDAKK